MWTVVQSIAACISTFAAVCAVIITVNSWKQQEAYKRPYFSIKNPGIRELPVSPPYRIIIPFENVGVRPASNFVGRICIIDANIKSNSEPIYTFDFSIANDIASGDPTPWYNDTLQLASDVPPCYIVFAIKYEDLILKRWFPQIFVMKWGGVANKKTQLDFVHTSIEEKQKVVDYLKNRFKEFTEKQG